MSSKYVPLSAKSGINRKVLEEIRALARRHDVVAMLLFGSRARGDFSRTSDIDLACRGGRIAHFAVDVDEETSTALAYDVVDLDDLAEGPFLDAIRREGVPILLGKYDNYISNLRVLQDHESQDLENPYVRNGLINLFSLQFELGWKLLKELLEQREDVGLLSGSPREVIRQAQTVYPFFDGDQWIEMLRARNDAMHIYSAEQADALIERILSDYVADLTQLETDLTNWYGDTLSEGLV